MRDLVLPLPQSEAFERTCESLGIPVQRFDSSQGTCLVQSRFFPVLGTFNLISRGPVFKRGQSDLALVQDIKDNLRGPVAINAPVGPNPIGGFKIAGGAELALIDLVAEAEMRARLHQKWRNQLKKAERSGLRVVNQPLDPKHHAWFFEAEAKQQSEQGYRSYPASFLQAYADANKGQARLYTALEEGQPVAAMLVLKHGRMATYQAGVTTPEGREHCAHNLLLWHIMTDLHRKKFAVLDLGRADLSPGLQRFKSGAGARIEELPGTYLFHKWLPGQWRRKSEPYSDLREAA